MGVEGPTTTPKTFGVVALWYFRLFKAECPKPPKAAWDFFFGVYLVFSGAKRNRKSNFM
jgi:hypothetical protein